jgi:phage-related protein
VAVRSCIEKIRVGDILTLSWKNNSNLKFVAEVIEIVPHNKSIRIGSNVFEMENYPSTNSNFKYKYTCMFSEQWFLLHLILKKNKQ